MPTLTPRLQTFLQQRLTSLDQIEVVLLLRGDPARWWTAPEVASALRTAPEPAAMRLFLLASGGMLVLDAAGVPRYRYRGIDAEADAVLAELADVFAANREAVASAVDSAPADPIRSFADAFKFKK